MSLNAAALKLLAEKGLSLADVAELAVAMEAKPARSTNAERQARYRSKRNERNVTRNVTPPPIEEDHTPPTVSNETVSRSRGPAKPEGVEDQVWTDFKQLRTKQKAPITATALAGIEREARKAGLTTNAALRETVERNWRGFKADWVQRDQTTAKPSRDPPSHLNYLLEQKRQREDWERRQTAN